MLLHHPGHIGVRIHTEVTGALGWGRARRRGYEAGPPSPQLPGVEPGPQRLRVAQGGGVALRGRGVSHTGPQSLWIWCPEEESRRRLWHPPHPHALPADGHPVPTPSPTTDTASSRPRAPQLMIRASTPSRQTLGAETASRHSPGWGEGCAPHQAGPEDRGG